VIVAPPSVLTILLALGAWIALSRDRSLGPLPAALMVMLALPYDRAADVGVLRVAGVPIRPQDVVLAAALVVSLPRIRTVRWTLGIRLVTIFLAVGLAALVIGAIGGQEPRDILRDVRWWALYGGALLLAGTPRPHARVLRAVILGLAVFTALLIVAALLPTIPGAIKERALTFDQGVLRLQFGPTAFLLLPIAWYGWRIARFRFSRRNAALLIYFVIGLTLSLTRVTLVVVIVMMLLVAALAAWKARPPPPALIGRLKRPALAVALAVCGMALAFGVNVVGVRVAQLTDPAAQLRGASGLSPTPVASATPSPVEARSSVPPTPVPTPSFAPTGPGGRFIPDLARLLAAVSDRFEGYTAAVELIRQSPLYGHGLGTLVDVDYTFGAGEFATEGKLPNVDNAYLTVGMKAGAIGIVAFALIMLAPLVRLVAISNRRLVAFWLPAWLALLALTLTQSFAVIGHSPFAIGLLIAALEGSPARRARGTRRVAGTETSRGSQDRGIAPS
jgi:hypothetical protein